MFSLALLYALAAGALAGAVVISAGLSGYAIAHLPGNRVPLLGLAASSLLVICVASGVLGSITYSRLPVAAVARVPVVSSGSSPTPAASPSQSDSTANSDTLQPATDAWMHFQSDTGDYIGAGVLKVWTLDESNFSIGGTNAYLRVSVSGKGDWWYLDFRAPSNGHLAVGQFDNAERAPFVTGKAPGLEVDGDGRGCNTLSGRFEIKTLTWTESATVAEIDVVFEQHCEGMAAALRGELWMTTRVGVHKPAPAAGASINF